jgi:hypothetical protein
MSVQGYYKVSRQDDGDESTKGGMANRLDTVNG